MFKKDCFFRNGVTNLNTHERQFIKLDDVGIFSTTHAEDAAEICQLIANLKILQPEFINKPKPKITDGCACCGGNVIAFQCCDLFEEVLAVEIDYDRCEYYLRNNINVVRKFRENSVPTMAICGNIIELSRWITQDVIFLDPPWGGPDYKNKTKISLYLSGFKISKVVKEIFNNEKSREHKTKCIILKVPQNFDIDTMIDELHNEEICLLKSFQKFELYVVYPTMEFHPPAPLTQGSLLAIDGPNGGYITSSRSSGGGNSVMTELKEIVCLK